jgi:hypothetical protein
MHYVQRPILLLSPILLAVGYNWVKEKGAASMKDSGGAGGWAGYRGIMVKQGDAHLNVPGGQGTHPDKGVISHKFLRVMVTQVHSSRRTWRLA